MKGITLSEVAIRTTLQPGDLGYITYLHGKLYKAEYNFGTAFEAYVAKGLIEFYELFDERSNRIWICEHSGQIVGCIALMSRGAEAQLRYFLILPEYRGIGLGKKLMSLYMDFLHQCGYRKSYLLTTDELHVAARLYEACGFRLTDQTETTGFGKRLIEHRYEWTAE
ncbi:MAG TPA: GNAT family N-acetyltransferase [Chryseosolibacter sp.]